MSGKPTIDVLVRVQSIAAVDAAESEMIALGYVALGEYVAPGGRLFAREEQGERLVNVHCFAANHPHGLQMIVMRDFFRTHPAESAEYARLKMDLYHKYPNDYEAYRSVKDPYLEQLTERVTAWAAKVY